MQYQISRIGYQKVFVLPQAVVDQHIKLAGALQLKVLLWLYYHQESISDLEAIALDLGATTSDVQDALQYWIVNGLIETTENDCDPIKEAPALVTASAAKVSNPITPPVRSQKPSRSEVAQRGQESEEVSWLLCEAQNKFQRTLSFAESSTLIWLMDTYGLSPAIILMVVEYAISVDKCNIRFIESTAIRWAKDEIDTVAKAEEHLIKLEQSRSDWNMICRCFGVEKRKPSKQEEIYISRWLHEWHFDFEMLKAAYDQCVNNTGKISFPYISKVLEQWHAAGYRKPEDIQQILFEKNGSNSKIKKSSQIKSTSIDLDEIELSLENK